MPEEHWSKNPKKVILVTSAICAGSLVFFYWLLVEFMGFDKFGVVAVLSTTAVVMIPTMHYSYGELKKKLAELERHNQSSEP